MPVLLRPLRCRSCTNAVTRRRSGLTTVHTGAPVITAVLFRLVPEPSAPSRSGAGDPHEPIPVYGAEEERQDVRLWRTVVIGEQEHRINMKVIEPYMRVISHGGAAPAAPRPEDSGRSSCSNGKERTGANQLLFCVFYQGYYGNHANAIIVFAACFLPDSDREDYHEIMENLFL